MVRRASGAGSAVGLGSWVDRRVTDCEWELRTSEKGFGSGFGRGARESGRPCTVAV